MASLAGLSASVTRILYLTGFSKELKTRDIQTAFSEWENANGGFKIKWRDDTSLFIVFNDPVVAKRAYLHTIAYPPPVLSSPSGVPAVIRPYDGPDAQTVIQTVNTRGQNQARQNHAGRSASISVFPSSQNRNGGYMNGKGKSVQHNVDRDQPSPTLPNLPTHPTLNALISEAVAGSNSAHSDPAILATSLTSSAIDPVSSAPRIGDPGKRMLGAALGVRHPSLGPRIINGNNNGGDAVDQVQRAMGGLVVAE
ncbi:hypothetical protein FISHEDRAFT_47470 [Fistulina hepatica ATCC 64428]|uniref:RRM domain-containing protein n=1 Tax=Fistulina hepatica ATCC 64428 TaxID=1128425 RepID=A0A0D7A6H1_9AGAR|nr:hypothetical protein FISHEDRAFT_47470 [Fistulina hepatica ATCC 64428]